MFNEVEAKARLIKLKKRQADLVLELRKQGIKATPTEVSQSMNGHNVFPKAELIRSGITKILDDWEANEAR